MRLRNFFALISLATLLGGCFGPIDSIQKSLYTFMPNNEQALASSGQVTSTVLVAMPNAAAGYDSSNMIYIAVPYKLKSFADNAWVAPPAQMFMPLLASTIRQMNYFGAVASIPFAGYTDYVLNTSIETLQQEFLQPTSKIRFVVLATMVSTKTHTIIASQRFVVEVRAPGNDPYAGVLASNKAANEMSDQIALFARKSVQSDRSKA